MCQDVSGSGDFFIQQSSRFCVNCPLSGPSIQWTIDLIPVVNYPLPLDYAVYPNNSLLMLSSQEGSYQCEDSAFNTHQFTVILAGK